MLGNRKNTSTPTGHLWYAQRAAAGAVAALGQSLDLDQVLPHLPGGYLQLHAGPVGLQRRSGRVPVVTVPYLPKWEGKS